MKPVTSIHRVWAILVALLGMAALGAGPALAQQVVKPAPMKSIQVKPVTRVVPDLLGKPLTEARKILKQAGFNKVEIKGARTKDARVQAQKPKGGEKAPLDAKVILRTALQKTAPATDGPGAIKREYPTGQRGSDFKTRSLAVDSGATKDKPRKPARAMPKRWDPGDYSPSSRTTKRKSAKKPGEVIVVGSKLKAESDPGDQQPGKGGFVSPPPGYPGRFGEPATAVVGETPTRLPPDLVVTGIYLEGAELRFRVKNLGPGTKPLWSNGKRINYRLAVKDLDNPANDQNLDGLAARTTAVKLSAGADVDERAIGHSFSDEDNLEFTVCINEDKTGNRQIDETDYINNCRVLELQAPPAAPTNLRVVRVTETSIRLQWDDNSLNEDGFKLIKSKRRASYDPRGYERKEKNTPLNHTAVATYTWGGLETGKEHCFRVRSRNKLRRGSAWTRIYSEWSNKVCATPNAPNVRDHRSR